MAVVERKELHNNELREKILSAAEALFVRDGYERVSMRRIAREIEYSATTLYRHFESKSDLMNQLIAAGYRGVHERYHEILEVRPESGLETLKLILSEYIDFALEHPHHYELWFATSETRVIDDRLQMRHGDVSYRVYRIWIDLIDECRAAGSLPDLDSLEIFQAIWTTVHGMISLRIHHPDFPWLPLERHIEKLWRLLEMGLD